jgi:CubicO group peptidase (beta-lactamase class C family)
MIINGDVVKKYSVMRKLHFMYLLLLFSWVSQHAQSLYFPPLSGNVWDTLAPQRFGWCQPRIDSLYNYLQVKNTKSFIILKDGKIVLEKYFGNYTTDSVFYWASASKSLASFITGIAQQKGFININTKVSQYIGNAWTNEPLLKENLITVKNLLQMNSGLDDAPPLPCSNEDTAKACLIYKTDAGMRWAYHTGAYKKVQDVVSAATNLNYNTVTANWVKTKIGMGGLWLNQVYYSKARDMARFGLLNLNKGIWNTDTVMKDSLYFKAMTSTSQNFNLSYGYLWWLNGKPTYMNPGIQLVLNGPLIPNCPSDMYAALGKNDQKIYVVPSQKMVVIRQGNSAEGLTFALSTFDNTLWDYINKLNCSTVSMDEVDVSETVAFFPNPANDYLQVKSDIPIKFISIINAVGSKINLSVTDNLIDVSNIKKGLYVFHISLSNNKRIIKKVILN